MKKNVIKLAIVAAGAVLGTAAHAEGYMGAGLGYAQFLNRDNSDIRDQDPAGNTVLVHNIKVDGSLGGQFYAGWRLEQSPLQFELAYLDLGRHKLKADFTVTQAGGGAAQSGSAEVRLGFRGLNASVGFLPWRSRATGSALWLKAGYYNGDTTSKFDSNDGFDRINSQKSTGASAGAGFDLMLSRQVGLRFDYQVLFNAHDFTGNDGHGTSHLGMAGAAVVFAFGNGSARAEPMGEHTYTGMPAAATPMAAATGVPVKGPAVLAGTVVRARPTLDAGASATLASETSVQLVSKTENSTGTWWYVKSGDIQGWVQDSQVHQ